MLSTNKMLGAMKKNDIISSDICDCCMVPVEEWFNKGVLNEGGFGTVDFVAPADDPLSALAMPLSRDLNWSSGDYFCLACGLQQSTFITLSRIEFLRSIGVSAVDSRAGMCRSLDFGARCCRRHSGR